MRRAEQFKCSWVVLGEELEETDELIVDLVVLLIGDLVDLFHSGVEGIGRYEDSFEIQVRIWSLCSISMAATDGLEEEEVGLAKVGDGEVLGFQSA